MGYLNATKLYGKQDSALIDEFNLYLFGENTQASRPLGKPQGVVFHHTAGTYNQCFNGYHFNVVYDVKTQKAHIVKNLTIKQLGQHLWGRNTGMLAISFSSMRGAVNMTNHPGPYPINAAMLQVATIFTAELCAWTSLNPKGNLVLPKKRISGNSLITVPGASITVPVLGDHAIYARHDGYFPSRWDVGGPEGEIMKALAPAIATHHDRLKSGKATFEYLGLLKE